MLILRGTFTPEENMMSPEHEAALTARIKQATDRMISFKAFVSAKTLGSMTPDGNGYSYTGDTIMIYAGNASHFTACIGECGHVEICCGGNRVFYQRDAILQIYMPGNVHSAYVWEDAFDELFFQANKVIILRSLQANSKLTPDKVAANFGL